MPKKLPKQKPYRSEQTVCTPDDFLKAVKKKLIIKEFSIDLAADSRNKIAKHYYDESLNALINPWDVVGGIGWCNPPYSDLGKWTAKAVEETRKGAKFVMLVPASVGSNWWRDNVDRKCVVMFLNGRLTFKGHKTPYPKDLALLYYDISIPTNYIVWDWRKDV